MNSIADLQSHPAALHAALLARDHAKKHGCASCRGHCGPCGLVEVLEVPDGLLARAICETCRRSRGQS